MATSDTADEQNKRDKLRSSVFSPKKFRKKIVNLGEDFNNVEVEVRQPSVGDVLSSQKMDDQREALVNFMVQYCYVPGTNEKVFEKGDKGEIMKWPIGPWFSRINSAITDLIDIDIERAEGNSG